MASSGVVKVILSFYRDDKGSAFERHRGRVPFYIEKHNSMEIACKHLTEFMGIKQQAEKFGLGGFDLKLFRLEKIDEKAENFENCDKGPAGNGATLSYGKCHK